MTYPVKLRQEIVAAVAAGMLEGEAARTFGVSIPTVERYLRQWRMVGHLRPRPPTGRPTAIPSTDLPALAAQLAAYPHAPILEQCRLWEQSHGRRVHRVTMGRAIRELGWIKRWSRCVWLPALEFAMSPPSRPRYTTDLTDAEWARLAPLVPPPKPGGRPARDRREIINAISYVVRTGCAWRLLPHDFPPWQTIYHYFRLWRIDGTWERIHDALREEVREQAGRERMPSAGIIDSQSVRMTEKGGSAAMTAPSGSTDANGTCW